MKEVQSEFEIAQEFIVACQPLQFHVDCIIDASILWVPSWCAHDQQEEEVVIDTPELTADFKISVYVTAILPDING